MYPKLSIKFCIYPERIECNYNDTMRRCEFMKYKIDPINGCRGQWICLKETKPETENEI